MGNLRLAVFDLYIHYILVFTRESSYCFQRVLAIAIPSVRPSVCHTVDQSRAVQARITTFSPSAAWKTYSSFRNRKAFP